MTNSALGKQAINECNVGEIIFNWYQSSSTDIALHCLRLYAAVRYK